MGYGVHAAPRHPRTSSGAPPSVDAGFCTRYHKHMGLALRRGETPAATRHCLCQGAAKGRIPGREIKPEVEFLHPVPRARREAAGRGSGYYAAAWRLTEREGVHDDAGD